MKYLYFSIFLFKGKVFILVNNYKQFTVLYSFLTRGLHFSIAGHEFFLLLPRSLCSEGNADHASPVRLTLPCEDICPYSRYPILVQMIPLKEAIFTIWQFYHFHHGLAQILCLAEEASLIGRLHFKSFHNYTIILEMHVCMLLRLHQFTALSAQFRTRFLFSGCKFPSFSSKWSIIAHIQANTLL